MNFDFSDEQRGLQQELANFLGEESPVARCRKALEAGTSDRSLMVQLGELGWLGIAVPEEFGGSGLGALELALAAEEMGRVLAPAPFGTSICGVADLLVREASEDTKARWLPMLATGGTVGTLAFTEKPGPFAANRLTTRFADGKVCGSKIAVAEGADADVAIVACASTDGPRWVAVDLVQDRVRREKARSVDPSRPIATLHFDDAAGEAFGDAAAIERALLRLAVFQAFEQIGGADAVFSITREYMNMREAFGRPISSYQALKHRAADIYTDLELARSNAYYAAWALSAGSDELAEAACCARLAASRAFELATVEAVQMHGGIGFTWESDCHLFYRRAKWLSGALGSQQEWRARLVAELDAQVI